MQPTVLIDGNAIARAYHHANKLTVGSFETQAIFGTVQTLRAMCATYFRHDLFVLWDGRAEHRFAMYPEYKSNRVVKDDAAKQADVDAYHAQVPVLRKAIECLGIKQLTVSNLEADDLAGYFATAYTKAAAARGDDANAPKMLLVTGDTDWLQLVSPYVNWLDPRGDTKSVTFADFLEKTGYHSPVEYMEGKCLVGDTADGISPVGGIGKEGAPLLIARWKSVAAFWAACDAGTYVPKTKAEKSLWQGTCEFDKDQWAAQFTGDATDAKALKKHMDTWPGQGRRLFERNLKLMKLIDAPAPQRDKMDLRVGAYNPDAYRAICERLAFNSMLKDLANFLDPFDRRWQERQLKAAA